MEVALEVDLAGAMVVVAVGNPHQASSIAS